MLKKISIAFAVAAILAGCTATPKVNYKIWYDWQERHLPDFSTLGEPAVVGVKANLDLEGIDDTKNHFCAVFETEIKVKTEEEYTFILTTDDGSRLYVDGEMLIESDGARGPIEEKAVKVLSKGKHAIKVEWFDYDKGQSIVFRYSTPTIKEREIDDTHLYREDRATSRHRFVKPQVKEAYKRFAAWKGDDEVLVYPILTDVHTCGRFSYKHIGYATVAAKQFDADFMVNLGDIGLNAYPATADAKYSKWILDNVRAQMDKYDGIWLYAPGNHDWDAGEGRLHTEQELQDFFQKPWEQRARGNLHLTPERTYGYYDIPEKNFRIVFLNSCTTRTKGEAYYLYGNEELAWLGDLLEATDPATNIIVLAHYMPHPMGRWTTSKPVELTDTQNNAIMDLLSEYAQKRTIVAMITGDSHTNDYINYKGVNYFVSQGYGWVVPDLMLPTNRHAFFDYKETLCIDVVAVKPATREVHTFRIGAGGADYDCVFSY